MVKPAITQLGLKEGGRRMNSAVCPLIMSNDGMMLKTPTGSFSNQTLPLAASQCCPAADESVRAGKVEGGREVEISARILFVIRPVGLKATTG